MTWKPIIKSRRDWDIVPNLHDYEAIRTTFSWEQARGELDGLPGHQGLNIAHEAVDRHANGARAQHLAIRWLGKNGQVQDYSYRQLQDLTNRFANVLKGLGVETGDRVFVLAGRIPELYITVLGALKHR
jgi:acetyl-CoA synthetase